MENSKAQASTNEFEVVQMFRIDTRVRIDLQGVIVVCRVLEKTVEGVELNHDIYQISLVFIASPDGKCIRQGAPSPTKEQAALLTISWDKRKKNSRERPP